MDTQKMLEKQMRYSAAIREIELAIFEVKFSLAQLQESLDLTSLGKLSSTLINPYNLSSILQQVSLQLPEGMTMLTGITVEEMYVYYAVAVVHAVATTKGIRFFIEIPLKTVDHLFELYQVHPLPFLHTGINRYMIIDESVTHIILSENRQFFTAVEPQVLSKCTKDFYTICPADLVLRTPRSLNCLTALFYGKADVAMSKCRRLMLEADFEPVWVRSPDFTYWIYSFSSPTHVTVQCQETGTSPAYGPGRQITLDGTRVLTDSSSCYIYSDTFKLMPRTMGRTTAALNKTHIILPNVDYILTSAEQELLQAPTLDLGDLQLVDEVISRSSVRSSLAGFEVRNVTETLRDQNTAQGHSSRLWILGIVCGLLLLAILLGCLMYMKYPYRITQCPWRTAISKRRRHVSHSFDENRDEIKLQVFVAKAVDEKEEGGQVDDLKRSPRSFVTRGQLSAEDM
jgi:hypothetical protein